MRLRQWASKHMRVMVILWIASIFLAGATGYVLRGPDDKARDPFVVGNSWQIPALDPAVILPTNCILRVTLVIENQTNQSAETRNVTIFAAENDTWPHIRVSEMGTRSVSGTRSATVNITVADNVSFQVWAYDGKTLRMYYYGPFNFADFAPKILGIYFSIPS
jgi:hypothetical protein